MATSGPWNKGMKWSTLWVRRSKLKVRRGQNRSQKSTSARYFTDYPTNFNQMWHANITVNAIHVTATQMQKFKGQRHIRTNLHLEAQQKHHSRLLGSSSFSSFCRAMLRKRGLCCHGVSVCVSVTFVDCVFVSKWINISLNFFNRRAATPF